MKISIVIVEGAKQVMMTPETQHERDSLKFIHPTDKLEVVMKNGTFSDKHTHAGLQVAECQGGYLRAFSESESIMFLIKDKKE